MQKALKFVFGLVGLLILLVVVAIVALVFLVNPNDYKSQISQKVYQYTGRQLTLNGEIHWTFFPWLGLQINQAQLSNLSGFGTEPFAQIQQADITVKLQPLLQRHIEVDKLVLKGLELHLITNAKGVANWQNITVPSPATNSVTTITPAVADTNKSQNSWLSPAAFVIAGIDVTDGHITYTDQQKKQAYDVSQLQLKSKSIAPGQAFPVDLHFVLQSPQPPLKSTVDFNANVTVNLNKQFLVDGKATIDNIHLTAANINTISTQFTAQNNASDISQVLVQGKATINDVQAGTTKVNGITAQYNINTANSLTANGNVAINDVQSGKFKINDIAAQYNYQNNTAKLSQIRAKLYQGTYTGNVTYVMSKVPQITTDSHLGGIQIETLFQDLTDLKRLQLTGTGEVNAHLVTAGSDADAMLARLSGNMQMIISNGAVKGIDIPHIINMGKALISKQVPPAQTGPNQTDFSKFSASATINNGVVSNNDLLLQSQYLQATGKGTVNIVKKNMNYQVTAQPVHPDSGKPDGIAIPIMITGSFDSLSIRPDLNSLVQSAVQQQIDKQKDNIKQRINVEIDKRLGNALGDQLKNQLNGLFGK